MFESILDLYTNFVIYPPPQQNKNNSNSFPTNTAESEQVQEDKRVPNKKKEMVTKQNVILNNVGFILF